MAMAPHCSAPACFPSPQTAASPSLLQQDLTAGIPPLDPVSPASTEYLLERSLTDLNFSPMKADPSQSHQPLQPGDSGLLQPFNVADLFAKFSELLDRDLHNTANKITSDIKADLQSIETCVEIIETNLEATISRTNQNTACLQILREQLESATAKIDELKNRNRRYNFRVRGLPESYKEIPETIRSFIKDLLPDTPQHRLELDWAHRALRPPRTDGLVTSWSSHISTLSRRR